MLKEFSKKVPQGKLVRLKIGFDSKINSIQINGDFFLHPEEVITKIENSLLGMNASDSVEEFDEKISNSLKKSKAQFIGLTSNDLAQIIKEAISDAQ